MEKQNKPQTVKIKETDETVEDIQLPPGAKIHVAYLTIDRETEEIIGIEESDEVPTEEETKKIKLQ